MCNICCYDIILLEPSTSCSVTLWLVTITITMSSDVTGVLQRDHDITLTLTLSSQNEKIKKKKIEIRKENRIFRVHCLRLWHYGVTGLSLLLMPYHLIYKPSLLSTSSFLLFATHFLTAL